MLDGCTRTVGRLSVSVMLSGQPGVRSGNEVGSSRTGQPGDTELIPSGGVDEDE